MSLRRNNFGVLGFAALLLSGAPVLLGSPAVNPGVSLGETTMTAIPSTGIVGSYFLAVANDHHAKPTDREKGQGTEGNQENNAGTDDSQPSMLPSVGYQMPIKTYRQDNRK